MLTVKNNLKINQFKKVSKKAFQSAQEKAAIQMLDWMSSGSPKSDKKPPIRTGVLASSGSAFYNNKFLKETPNVATKGTPTPNYQYSGKEITWGFNTEYAKRMHEDKLTPGEFSSRDSGRKPGNQWMTAHLSKDKKLFIKVIAEFLKKKL